MTIGLASSSAGEGEAGSSSDVLPPSTLPAGIQQQQQQQQQHWQAPLLRSHSLQAGYRQMEGVSVLATNALAAFLNMVILTTETPCLADACMATCCLAALAALLCPPFAWPVACTWAGP